MSEATLFPLTATASRDRCEPRRSSSRRDPAPSCLGRLQWIDGRGVLTTTGLSSAEIAGGIL